MEVPKMKKEKCDGCGKYETILFHLSSESLCFDCAWELIEEYDELVKELWYRLGKVDGLLRTFENKRYE